MGDKVCARLERYSHGTKIISDTLSRDNREQMETELLELSWRRSQYVQLYIYRVSQSVYFAYRYYLHQVESNLKIETYMLERIQTRL